VNSLSNVSEIYPDIVLIKDAIGRHRVDFFNRWIEDNIDLFGQMHAVTKEIEAYYSENKDRPLAYFVKHEDSVDEPLQVMFKDIQNKYSEYYDKNYGSIVGISGDEGYRFSIYTSQNSTYKFHTDSSYVNKHRRVSCIVCLSGSEEYDGGQLHFPRFNAKIKLKCGEAILFPSIYTHPHEVLPVTGGQRKTVMTWFI